MRQKTVLMLLTNAYDPDPRVRQEALTLTAMGCRVQLLCWDRDRKRAGQEIMEGIEVERLFLPSSHGRGTTQILFYVLLYLSMFWRGFRKSFHVVHCHDLDTLPIGFLLGKLKRKPIVYDAHESFPDMLHGNVALVVERALTRLEDFLIRRIDLLITVGEKLKRHFVARGARRAVVVGNWKRVREFERSVQQNMAVRRRIGIPEDALVVVCITQLLHDRKIEELLGALKDSNVYLILGGKGVLEERVKQAASTNSQIRFVGFVSGGEIADYTCAADVVYYGFDPQNPNARFSAPNKLYEALAAGRPLLTGDFGEIADVVRNIGCGVVLAEYSTAEIKRGVSLLADPEVRRSMACKAWNCGRTAMNWGTAEEVLYREYSGMLPGSLKQLAPEWNGAEATAGV